MRAALVTAAGLLLLAGPARAGDGTGPPAPGSVASPTPTISQRLKLGAYGSAHADDPSAVLDQPRFEEHVEVRGKAMDARSLTTRLEWWLKDTDPTRGPVPVGLTAPSIQEMHDYRPHPSDALNLEPVMQWLAEKLGGKKK
jgi:hypothetical protein